MKVTDYIVVHESSIRLLCEEVNKHMDEGFQPIGGMTVDTSAYALYQTGVVVYCQAMVKVHIFPLYRLYPLWPETNVPQVDTPTS